MAENDDGLLDGGLAAACSLNWASSIATWRSSSVSSAAWASAREEPPHGAAKETQVGPVPLLREAAVEAEEGIALLVGGGDDAVADLDLDGLDQDQRENGGGQEKVHGGERRVRRRRRRQVRGCVSL